MVQIKHAFFLHALCCSGFSFMTFTAYEGVEAVMPRFNQ
jgi:hypothetical protein